MAEEKSGIVRITGKCDGDDIASCKFRVYRKGETITATGSKELMTAIKRAELSDSQEEAKLGGATFVNATLAGKKTKAFRFLVDTGSSFVGLPEKEIQALGLVYIGEAVFQLPDKEKRGGIYGGILQYGNSTMAVLVTSQSMPVLGFYVLEELKLKVNLISQEVETTLAEVPDIPEAELAAPKLKPKQIIRYARTVEYHFASSKQFHPGSFRVVTPNPETRLYIGCPKSRKWDGKRCEATATLKMIVLLTTANRKKYERDIAEWQKQGVPVKQGREGMATVPMVRGKDYLGDISNVTISASCPGATEEQMVEPEVAGAIQRAEMIL